MRARAAQGEAAGGLVAQEEGRVGSSGKPVLVGNLITRKAEVLVFYNPVARMQQKKKGLVRKGSGSVNVVKTMPIEWANCS